MSRLHHPSRLQGWLAVPLLLALGMPACASGGQPEPSLNTLAPATNPPPTATQLPPTATNLPPVYADWVYLDSPDSEARSNRVIWADGSGAEVLSHPAPGSGHRLVGDWVYFSDDLTHTIHRMNAAGQHHEIRLETFFAESGVMPSGWAASPDGTMVAWGRFWPDTATGQVISELYITEFSGQTRLLAAFSSAESAYTAPWHFSPDGSRLFVHQSPWGIGGYILFEPIGAVSLVDIATGDVSPLPEENPGFTPATLNERQTHIVRVGFRDGARVITLFDIATGQTAIIGAVPEGYAQAGDAFLSPDGTRVVYTAALGVGPESDAFAIYEINMVFEEQRALLPDQPVQYRVFWFEDGSMLVLHRVREAVTDRLMNDGSLVPVAPWKLLGLLPG